MRGHIRERCPGRWAIVLDTHDAARGSASAIPASTRTILPSDRPSEQDLPQRHAPMQMTSIPSMNLTPPGFRGGQDKLEHHQFGGRRRKRFLRPHRPVTNRENTLSIGFDVLRWPSANSIVWSLPTSDCAARWECLGDRAAGDGCPLASCWFSFVLAMEGYKPPGGCGASAIRALPISEISDVSRFPF
jgi:hypothetical protein